MKQSVNFHHFKQAFYDYNRQDNFPDGGLYVLFDYLEQYEEDWGTELELDVIALCCDFYQMNVEDIARDYDIDVSERYDAGGDDIMRIVMEYLIDNTLVVGEVGDDQIIFKYF